jgi:hypothetical protein
MTTAIANVCDGCQGAKHQPLEVLRYNPRQRSWLCTVCRAAPKDRPVNLDEPAKAKVYPKVSPLILGGLVRVFSSCRDCGLIMQVTDVRDTVHPMCQPRPTRIENWEQSWMAIAKLAPYQQLSPKQQHKLDELEFKMETEADQSQKTALTRAAVQYAEWGWKVFPLARHSKRPFLPSAHPDGDPLRGVCKGECGKPGHGFLDGTNDVNRICKWWSRHPDHNIGLATGHLFDVVDIDPGAGGAASLVDLLHDDKARKTLNQIQGIVATAGADETRTETFRPSGMHLYVKATGKGNFAGLRPGIDYRGKSGYIVAPPSTLGSRVRSWSWAVAPSPEIKGTT